MHEVTATLAVSHHSTVLEAFQLHVRKYREVLKQLSLEEFEEGLVNLLRSVELLICTSPMLPVGLEVTFDIAQGEVRFANETAEDLFEDNAVAELDVPSRFYVLGRKKALGTLRFANVIIVLRIAQRNSDAS